MRFGLSVEVVLEMSWDVRGQQLSPGEGIPDQRMNPRRYLEMGDVSVYQRPLMNMKLSNSRQVLLQGGNLRFRQLGLHGLVLAMSPTTLRQ